MAKVIVTPTDKHAGHPTTPNVGGVKGGVKKPTSKATVRNPGIGPDKPSGRGVGA